MSKYGWRLCGPSACPNDPEFEHDNYYGCIPLDFKEYTGRSATYTQIKNDAGRYKWNGGCDATGVPRKKWT